MAVNKARKQKSQYNIILLHTVRQGDAFLCGFRPGRFRLQMQQARRGKGIAWENFFCPLKKEKAKIPDGNVRIIHESDGIVMQKRGFICCLTGY